MTDEPEFQQTKHAAWAVASRAQCYARSPDGEQIDRSERSSYAVDGRRTLTDIFAWVERTEHAKYEALGWAVVELEYEVTPVG